MIEVGAILKSRSQNLGMYSKYLAAENVQNLAQISPERIKISQIEK